jgi:GGDEF domain-containing protein
VLVRTLESAPVRPRGRAHRLPHLVAGLESVIENTRLYLMAVIDGLTGLYVRRYFDLRLAEEFNMAKRYGRTFALIS